MTPFCMCGKPHPTTTISVMYDKGRTIYLGKPRLGDYRTRDVCPSCLRAFKALARQGQLPAYVDGRFTSAGVAPQGLR